MTATCPFESLVAKNTHEEWLNVEAQNMLNVSGLGAESLCSWQGSVDGAFDLDYAGKERSQLDRGLSQAPNDPKDETHLVPSLVIQSCWAVEYAQAFSDMQEWMKQGGGAVQVVILLKWNIVTKNPSDPIYILQGEIEVFKYSAEAPAKYQRTRHEKLTSADFEDPELQALNITASELFGGKDPHGNGAFHDLSLSELWNTALDIFENEVEEHLQTQPSSSESEKKDAPIDDTSVDKEAETDESDCEGIVEVGERDSQERIITKEVITGFTVKTTVYTITTTEHLCEESQTICTGSDFTSAPLPAQRRRIEASSDSVEAKLQVVNEPVSMVLGQGESDMEANFDDTDSEDEDGQTPKVHSGTPTRQDTVDAGSEGLNTRVPEPHVLDDVPTFQDAEDTDSEEEDTRTPETRALNSVPIPQDTEDTDAEEEDIRAPEHNGGVTSQEIEGTDSEEEHTRTPEAHVHDGIPIPQDTENTDGEEEDIRAPEHDGRVTSHEIEGTDSEAEDADPNAGSPAKCTKQEIKSVQFREGFAEQGTTTRARTYELTSPRTCPKPFSLPYDQSLIGKNAYASSSSTRDVQCTHCVSSRCCNGPNSPLRHLPPDFMSAGVLGPFTFDGFVAYIALSTTESVSAEAVEIFSSKFTSQFQQFIQSTYIESPPKDSAQAKLTPISKEQSTSTSKAEKNTSTLAVSSSTKGKGPTVRITPRSITESESESESESEPEPEDDDRLEATGANTFKGAGHQVAMSGFGSVVTQSTTSLRNSSRKGSRYKEKAMGAVNKALETVGDAACRMAPRLRGIRNRKSNIVVSEKIDTNGAYEMTMISAESPPAQQVQPFSPTSPSESRFGRGRLIRGEIPPGIVFNLQKKLEAVEPGQTVITGGPLPLSRRNSSAQRNGTLEYIPKATFSNIEQKEATAKLAKATATVGRWGSPSFTTADSRRRSSAFSSFSRSDSEEDSIPVKPRGPPLRNVEIRSASCSYDPRITRKKLAVQAHSYEPGNAFMISNCTEGLALHGQLSLSTGSSTAQSLSCSGHIHSTDYSQQTSRGDWLQCSCGGHGIPDVTARQQTANPQTVSAQLMAQLQALIGKIYAQTGQLVVPKLNVHMACEGSESAEEMMEMEVDVRLKYVSNKTVEHVGPCTQLREFLGVGSTCAVMEELLQN